MKHAFFFALFLVTAIMILSLTVKSCLDDVKQKGLKNILDQVVEEYWEADTTNDSTEVK